MFNEKRLANEREELAHLYIKKRIEQVIDDSEGGIAPRGVAADTLALLTAMEKSFSQGVCLSESQKHEFEEQLKILLKELAQLRDKPERYISLLSERALAIAKLVTTSRSQMKLS